MRRFTSTARGPTYNTLAKPLGEIPLDDPNTTVAPNYVTGTTTIGAPGISVTLGVSVVAGTATVGAPALFTGQIISATTVDGSATIDTVNFTTPTAVTVDGTATVPVPVVSFSITVATVSASASVPVPILPLYVRPANLILTTTIPTPIGFSTLIGVNTISGISRVGFSGLYVTQAQSAPDSQVVYGAAVTGDQFVGAAQIPIIVASNNNRGARWVLIDTYEPEVYQFELNPEDTNVPQYVKDIKYQRTFYPAGLNLIYEANDNPLEVEWEGRLLTEAQYNELSRWFAKRRKLTVVDDLGRSYDILMTEFRAQRKRNPHYPWLHEYSISAHIVS